MGFMFNTNVQENGILPVDCWKPCEAKTSLEALQCACDTLEVEQLPITIHIADDKHLHSNGVPFMTTAYMLEKEVTK